MSQHVWFFIIYCSLLFVFLFLSQPTMVPSASTRALAMAVPFSSSFLSQAQQQQQQQPQQQLPVFHSYQQPQPHLTALHDAGTVAIREKGMNSIANITNGQSMQPNVRFLPQASNHNSGSSICNIIQAAFSITIPYHALSRLDCTRHPLRLGPPHHSHTQSPTGSLAPPMSITRIIAPLTTRRACRTRSSCSWRPTARACGVNSGTPLSHPRPRPRPLGCLAQRCGPNRSIA